MDLSYNNLVDIDTGVFAALPSLTSLSLGHNLNLTLGSGGATFKGIEDTLQFLDLDNISLATVCILKKCSDTTETTNFETRLVILVLRRF